MNLKNYTIVKAIPSIVRLVCHLIVISGVGNNPSIASIYEITLPQQFFFRAC